MDRTHTVFDAGATLRFDRPKVWADRARAYRVFVDDELVGKIKERGTLSVRVAPGAHTIRAKMDWMSSGTLHIHVEDGEIVPLECVSNASGLRLPLGMVFAVFRPSRYLNLRLVDS